MTMREAIIKKAAVIDAAVQRAVDAAMARLAWWGLPKYMVIYVINLVGVAAWMMSTLTNPDRTPVLIATVGFFCLVWLIATEWMRRHDERHADSNVLSAVDLARRNRLIGNWFWKVYNLMFIVLDPTLLHDDEPAITVACHVVFHATMLLELYAIVSPPRPPQRRQVSVPVTAQPEVA
jgi:uncharacterized membrane protein